MESRCAIFTLYIKWNLRKHLLIMLNTDDTFSSHLNNAGVGGVFCNSSGDWLLVFTTTNIPLTPPELEIIALFKGL